MTELIISRFRILFGWNYPRQLHRTIITTTSSILSTSLTTLAIPNHLQLTVEQLVILSGNVFLAPRVVRRARISTLGQAGTEVQTGISKECYIIRILLW